jgi:uncharacterized membrane protein YphA (DoxX/SURF4 family)
LETLEAVFFGAAEAFLEGAAAFTGLEATAFLGAAETFAAAWGAFATGLTAALEVVGFTAALVGFAAALGAVVLVAFTAAVFFEVVTMWYLLVLCGVNNTN